ncbi:hypothetical protein M0R04_00275 [Candidatus Dojkabacteria bacterium]|jgi:hypothetical protein|nr:hypothetical protein [Candidatus Dojkabacteria bacterium]
MSSTSKKAMTAIAATAILAAGCSPSVSEAVVQNAQDNATNKPSATNSEVAVGTTQPFSPELGDTISSDEFRISSTGTPDQNFPNALGEGFKIVVKTNHGDREITVSYGPKTDNPADQRGVVFAPGTGIVDAATGKVILKLGTLFPRAFQFPTGYKFASNDGSTMIDQFTWRPGSSFMTKYTPSSNDLWIPYTDSSGLLPTVQDQTGAWITPPPFSIMNESEYTANGTGGVGAMILKYLGNGKWTIEGYAPLPVDAYDSNDILDLVNKAISSK